eukprot:scaffold70405_cov69-Phaeocystis_antarctica.AAC.1
MGGGYTAYSADAISLPDTRSLYAADCYIGCIRTGGGARRRAARFALPRRVERRDRLDPRGRRADADAREVGQ